ncbi:MAG: hypothetical protein ABIU29_08235 [Chthoniobacterales bacterium]
MAVFYIETITHVEAALLVRLEPGAYTTVSTNGDGAMAIALIEVYEIGFE